LTDLTVKATDALQEARACDDARAMYRGDEEVDRFIERRAAQAANEPEEPSAIAEELKRRDLAAARERRQQWAEYFRIQIRVADDMRERAVANLGRLLDEPMSGGRPHVR
jgi:hypothetical protein